MFDPQDYLECRKPLGEASTLPAHCYTDESFYERERERVFAVAWHFAGRVDEWKTIGAFRVVDTPTGSVLVCRGKDGDLRGFVNACRHRGTRLKDCSGTCKTIVCPYHAWTYDLEGRLRSARGMEQALNFDPDAYGLEPVRLETWGGFVFFNHSISAPSLEQWLGDLGTRMGYHKPYELRCVRRMEFIVASNWKFLIENALEAYHTGTVHRATLGQQSSEPVETSGQWNALFVPSDENKSISTLPGEVQVLPFIEGLVGHARTGTWFTVIYPCTQIVFSPDCVWWLDFKPLAVDRTALTLGACFSESTVRLPDFEQRIEPYLERWSSATPEDNAIAEAQQRGHQAGSVRPGRYAATEHCVHALDNWLLDRVLDSEGEHAS